MKRSRRKLLSKLVGIAEDMRNAAKESGGYTSYSVRQFLREVAYSAHVYPKGWASIPGLVTAIKHSRTCTDKPVLARINDVAGMFYSSNRITMCACSFAQHLQTRTDKSAARVTHPDVLALHLARDVRMIHARRAAEHTLVERVSRRREKRISNMLTDKGVKASMHYAGTLVPRLPKGWCVKVAKFCAAAARDRFVVDADFIGMGADGAMLYQLRTFTVSGRGYNREVLTDAEPLPTHYGAIIMLNGEEFVGVGGAKHTAIAAARAKAGESAAKTLEGDFSGGFL